MGDGHATLAKKRPLFYDTKPEDLSASARQLGVCVQASVFLLVSTASTEGPCGLLLAAALTLPLWAPEVSLCWVLLLAALVGLCVATDLHNSLINSSTLEVNEPRREDKEQKFKTARPKDPLVVQTKSGLWEIYATKSLSPSTLGPASLIRLSFRTHVSRAYNYFPGFIGEQIWNPNTDLSEDCLFLNIWAPAHLRDPGAEPTEVLVWIYGGGYMGGTSTLDIYDADIMATANNFIVASMQYRCGAFGYLYLDIEDAPGNVGMYDQALAMKWIRDNIEFFGGNPDRITLFGESAGAGSIAVHLLSPVSSHLFDRAILQSGVVNSPWSIMSADKAYDIGLRLVDDVGCNASLINEEPEMVMDCMRRVDPFTLSLQQWNSYFGLLQFPSTPIVDGDFLPDEPLEMIPAGG
ncbi:Acetylcholinesterase-like 5 [Homarus americanus]|uniref:Carboxylic ester hydrolase n=1 Tax=Homarus americanus TaxID=6706 RepID=A0A8J5JW32_HOMAM|nr:Acetylcholinesterase-like 5 [Homarus americanus]